ncbi:hypothetical protein [Streptomyces lasiicapitis]|uniref:RING-type domain-containing protein n=1 Tax=Streptomyces lasiicapitis TaxID=1923961 RepID=A0ABQ2MRR4_9ACTN|nr:hypothetical protein [Streptomyces lasiicapitis]GGO56601.1 hypothetical protein GCM10012286_71450 [Streptomyces lasiicapitis]
MTTADDLAGLLLRRRQSVYVPSGAGRSAVTDAAVVVLEAELADRGHLLTVPLRRALAALPAAELAVTGMRLLADVDALMGSDRRHAPLFARFPEEIPYQHAYDRYTSLVVAHLVAQPHQPCMNCAGTKARVRALAPCAHLVCDDCHGVMTDWGCCEDCCVWYACPVCETRYETSGPTDPWIDTAADASADSVGDGGAVLRALRLGAPDDAAAELGALLGRRTPLNPQDHDDLVLLLARVHAGGRAVGGPGGGLGWVPDQIPLRESKALVLASFLDDPEARSFVARYAGTATDVLRLLVVRSGGDPDLLELPRLRPVSRPVRRELLGLLGSFDLRHLCEDFARYPAAWKRVGEILHPFEGGARAARHARVALAFAVLRGTRLDESALTDVLLTEAARHDDIRLDGDRLRYAGWQGRVEAALARWDTTGAAALLRARPGELLRRLDVLLARSGEVTLSEPVAEALGHALPRVGVGALLGAYGRMKVRAVPGGRRVFFPRGRVTKAYAVDDHRPPLPSRVAARVAELIEAEAVRRLEVGVGPRGCAPVPPLSRNQGLPPLDPADRRFAARPQTPDGLKLPSRTGEGGVPYDIAVLDASLGDLPVPFAERASAASLVSVPRGSSLPMPGDSENVRLFLHWQQPKGVRVDLDLSVALYDDAWRFVGLCDYTQLEYAGGAALHSGDLTAAPAPHGATEYLDLDLARLAKAGVRFVVPVVLSYNDVPFDQLPDAFAGFMAVSGERKGRAAGPAVFDPRTVRQRFDLAGDAALRVPMIVDLRSRRAWWADLTLATGEGNHNVWRYSVVIGRAGHDLLDSFEAGGRATMWDLACWTAAARTDGDVLVRGRGHVLWGYRREPDEPRADFAVRIRDAWEPDVLCAEPELADRHALVALVHGDLAGAEHAASGTAYRLFPGVLDEAPLTRVTASDLAGWPAPDG